MMAKLFEESKQVLDMQMNSKIINSKM